MSIPAETARVSEIAEQLHAGIPAQRPLREDIIRNYAIAKWRSELAFRMEAAFFEAAIAEERANPASADLIEKYGEDILLGAAIRRDAAGPNALSKIMRYQASVNKNLQLAKDAYVHLLDQIQTEMAIEKAKPISRPEPALFNSELGMNAPCKCGSGRRNKNCCGAAAFAARAVA